MLRRWAKNTNCQTLVSLTLASGEVLLMVGLRLFVPSKGPPMNHLRLALGIWRLL
jgi:hypothetical protein